MTTIAVSEQTKEELRSLGHKGETYDEILHRAVAAARKQLFFEAQEKLLEEGEFVPLDEV